MKKNILFILLAVLAVIFISSCDLADAVSGLGYTFDTPEWIQGSWTNDIDANEVWTFTATNVIYNYDGDETDYGSPEISRPAGSLVILDESSSSTMFEFTWVSVPYDFVRNTDTTLTLLGYKNFTKN